MKKAIALLLAFLLPVCFCAAAEESSAAAAVKALVWQYYEAAVEVAQASPDYGRDFTDHKTAHAEMAAAKSLEAAYAISEAVRLGTLGAPAQDGRVALSGDIDYKALEAAALFHDTGMCGGGYAIAETQDENGAAVCMKDAEGRYVMHPEDNLNFFEVRTYHSLNSALYVLINRGGLNNAGFSDGQVDLMAVICMAHSKSNSGVRDLNSKDSWKDCFDRIDACVAAWNADHPEESISFDRTVFESDDTRLGALVSGTLAMRIGDVSRDSGPDAEVQTGEKVHVDRETLNSRGGTVEAEVEGALITIGTENENVPSRKSRQVHAGEQNISESHTLLSPEGFVIHEITVIDGCSAPRCTQESVNDHLGEFFSARDEHFTVRIFFTSFEDTDDGFFTDSWEDYRIQAAQDYPGIEIQYPWDEEVSE